MTSNGAVNGPHVSIVVGTKNTEKSIVACIWSLLAQAEAAQAEIIVADASTDNTADLVSAEYPQVKLLRNQTDELVPVLWKQGLEASQAPIVAFTIGQCIPSADWLSHILRVLEGSAVAVGGPLAGPKGGSRLDWGLYFSRYSRFLPSGKQGPVEDVAGDNAAYKRVALERCRSEWEMGFWENLVNARLRANGEILLWEPGMAVKFAVAENLGDIIRNRFRHGRHYASTRLDNTLPKRVLRIAAAPLLVPVLLTRIYRRVREGQPGWLRQFWRSLPVILVILATWSAGEMSGYAFPKRLKR